MKQKLPLLLISLLFGLLIYKYFKSIETVSFHPDESHWIHTSKYFNYYIKGDWKNEEWNSNYWTLTHPPMTRYVYGLSRINSNYYSIDSISHVWDFRLQDSLNYAMGNKPSLPLLNKARSMSTVVSLLSILILVFILWTNFNSWNSVLFLFFFYFNSVLEHLVRAMSESIMFFVTAMSLLLISLAHKKGIKNNKLYLILASILSAIGISTKLNLLSLIPTFLIAYFLIFEFKLIKKKLFADILIFLLVFIVISLLLNPFLLSNPIQHIISMFNNRSSEIASQILSYPESYNESLINRVLKNGHIVLYECYGQYNVQLFVLYSLLLLSGLMFFGNKIIQQYKLENYNHFYVIYFVFIVINAMPFLFSPLNWNRYFVLIIIYIMPILTLVINWYNRNREEKGVKLNLKFLSYLGKKYKVN